MSVHDVRHWDRVWTGDPVEKTWYQPSPRTSLALLESAGLGSGRSLVDVGGGASTLVDHLLEAGWHDVTVVDIAEGSLQAARDRLGPTASRAGWIAEDVLVWEPQRTFDIWHDRALFHFLTEAADREAYLRVLRRALAPGGHAIVATFAGDGPDRCSGLPTTRWDPESLSRELSPVLDPVCFEDEWHRTPSGGEQHFLYGLFRRTDRR